MRPYRAALALALALTACGAPGVASAPIGPTEARVRSTPPAPTTATRQATPAADPTATATPNHTQPPLPTQPVREGCGPGAESCVLDWPFPLQPPIYAPGAGQSDATYRYGATQNGARDPHHGVDLSSAFGTPVYATADGEVIFAGSDAENAIAQWMNFYGNAVVLQHELPGISEPVYTLYGHLSKVDAVMGETVSAGDEIGEVGASGVALGSHLHLEVRLGANDYASTRNPELWMAPAPPGSGAEIGVAPGTLAVRAVDSHGNLVPLSLEVQYFADPAGPVTQTFPVEPYYWKEKFPVNSDDVLGENFVLGSLPPGRYRLSFIYWGVLYERWVDVAPGKLTFTEFALE